VEFVTLAKKYKLVPVMQVSHGSLAAVQKNARFWKYVEDFCF